MPSLVGLTRGPIRHACTGVLLVYDCWQQLVVTAYPCTPRQRIPQPDEDDGWISSWSQPSSNGPFKGHTNISIRSVNRCVTINQRWCICNSVQLLKRGVLVECYNFKFTDEKPKTTWTFATHVQSVPITTTMVSSNPVHGEVYSIQTYLIKFVNKTDHHDITETSLNVVCAVYRSLPW